ncbi:uncharacterized protein LOC144209142 [Stigmatopora nigra]
MSSSPETLESSSSEVSNPARLQHGDKVRNKDKDGGFPQATTTKNVMPELISSQLELNSKVEDQANTCREVAENEVIKLQQKMEETSADVSSVSSPSLSPISSPCTDSSSPLNLMQQVDEGKGEDSPYSPSPVNKSNGDSSDQERQPYDSFKELQQTQKELSRLQQLNRKLQDELQQERDNHLSEKNDILLSSNPTSEPLSTLRRLQKMNRELRVELETQKRTHEETREAELRQRVDLLAQQAQMLVTGDATALAQAHLEQERKWFHEQRVDWERSSASLKTQLSTGEEKWRESERRLLEMREESNAKNEEVQVLRKALQEASAQLHANEDAQAQKEVLLQKHLALLQASQDRERKSLSAGLARSEQRSRELRQRLDRAEQQVESFDTLRMWSRDCEETQKQLQEDLASSMAVVQEHQDDKERLERQCQKLQEQLSETQEEVRELRTVLKTEQTRYHELKESHETISEELLQVLEKTQQIEDENQQTHDGFQRLLHTKEQELNEVLLKMEVLGNSLEETEARLNEMVQLCTCASSRGEEGSSGEMAEPQLTNDRISEDVFSGSPTDEDSNHHTRIRSHSLGPSHQYIVSSGDDPERFTSAIQLLETKLFVTEEKLREITDRLEEHQDFPSGAPPPHLLLQSQAERAREIENFCQLLVSRFQLALNIVRSCRDKLQTSTEIELTDFERRLSAVETCLQQGQNDAEKQKHAYRMEDAILSHALSGSENGGLASTTHSEDILSVGEYIMREFIVVDKMLAALQSPNQQLTSLMPKEDGTNIVNTYKDIISQLLSLKKTPLEGFQDNELIIRACSEAELIYATFKIQQKVDKSQGLVDVGFTDFTSQTERENEESLQSEERPPWLEGLITRLQRRAQFVCQLSQEVICVEEIYETSSVGDLKWMQERAKLVYLSDRLYLDLEREQQQNVALREKLGDWSKQQDASLKDERDVFNRNLCGLEGDNVDLTGDRLLPEKNERIEHCYEERTQKLEAEKLKAIELRNKNLQDLAIPHIQKCPANSQLRREMHFERKSFRNRRERLQRKPEQSSLQTFEADINLLRQEVFSLREELKVTRMDKEKTLNKTKDGNAETYQDITKPSQDIKYATLPSTRIATGQNHEDNTANTSRFTVMKKTDKPSLLRRLRAVRSKSFKEGLSGQEKQLD